MLSFPLLLLCLTACLFRPDERLLFGFWLFILWGFAVAITDEMPYKIALFLIWYHRFIALVAKVKVSILKDVLPEEQIKSQLQPSGLSLLILLPSALLLIDLLVQTRRNLLYSGLRVAGFESSVCHSAKTSAQ